MYYQKESAPQAKCATPGAPAADPRIGYFNGLAPRWDVCGPNPSMTLQRLEALQPRLGLHAGHSVLELGCGTGQVTSLLAGWVKPGRVVGVDFAPAMLEQAQAKTPSARFMLLDICEQPAPEPCDVVFAFNVFPHLRDRRLALRHIAQSLRPGGALIVLHLMGSAKLNALHRSLGEPVCHDLLPPADQWPGLLAPAQLTVTTPEDRDDLFLLKATRAA